MDGVENGHGGDGGQPNLPLGSGGLGIPAGEERGLSGSGGLGFAGSGEPALTVVFSARLGGLAVVAGVAAGIAGGGLMRLLRWVQHVGFGYSGGSFLAGVAAASPLRRLLCLLIAGALAGAAVLARRWKPLSGPAGLETAVWRNGGRMPFRAAALDIFESITVVGLGVSLGREGALKQAGAAVASRLGAWAALGETERRVLVSVAAGAGIAAAYNIPLGGALYAAEVLLGTMSLPVVLLAALASGAGTAASWLLLPDAVTYSTPVYVLHARDLLGALVLAPALGVLAAVWTATVRRAKRNKTRGVPGAVLAVAVFGGLGLLAMRFPAVLGNGRGLVQASLTDLPGMGTLAVLFGLKFAVTAACVRTGTPGGLMTPTMSLGALFGGLLGRLWGMVVPGSDPGIYALLGSAVLLAISTQGPMSALAMVWELTAHAGTLMVPMLLATLAAWVVARALMGGRVESVYGSGG